MSSDATLNFEMRDGASMMSHLRSENLLIGGIKRIYSQLHQPPSASDLILEDRRSFGQGARICHGYR